ncbi:MAG TPA: choice-of-anchor L domain-containing protein [Thermoleophilaceae bacterium]
MEARDGHARMRRWRRSSIAVAAGAAVVAVGAASAPAHAAITITPTGDASAVAQAILDDPSTLAGASFTTQPLDPESGEPPLPAQTAAIGLPDGGTTFSGFPVAGADFGLLSTGDPTIVTQPNDSPSSGEGFDDPPDLAAARGESVHDATTLKIDFTVPSGANCLSLSYRFLSEEFPEFVGSRFNDAFVAELDKTTWTTDAANEIVVPDDFATKAGGKPVSVNGVGPTAVNEAEAEGTTFDAATGLVISKTPVTPGAHSVYLSIFDQTDNIYDSLVMLDRLAFLTESATTCKPPEVPVIVPPPPAPPAPPGPPPPPNNTFTVPGGSVTFRNGSATITIQVPGPGVVTAADSGAAGAARLATAAGKRKRTKKAKRALIKPTKATATKAGPVTLKLKPTKAGKKLLKKKHKLKVKLAITFTPTGGTPKTQVKTITIKVKQKKRHRH